MVRKKLLSSGFTLAELMIVITIIAILAVFGLLAFQRQTIRGFDVKRKTDISKLKVVFEDYYNDHQCYPQVATWNGYNCADGSGGQFFAPYLQGEKIPCDPVTNERYLYVTIPEDAGPSISACSGYKLFAALGNLSDQDIPGSGCSPDPQKGCGYPPFKYNYGISVGGTIANPVFDFQAPAPTPTSKYAPGSNFCVDRYNPEKLGGRYCEIFDGLVYKNDPTMSCADAFRDSTIGNCGNVSFADPQLCLTECQTHFLTTRCPATTWNICRQP